MAGKSIEQILQRVEALATPAAAERGCVVYDVEARRHGYSGTVRVLVERAPGGDAGVTVGELGAIAREVGFAMDAEETIDFPYTFEVSSPGVERTLRTRRQFEQNVGAQVRLVLGEHPAPNGDRVVVGRLARVEGDVAVVAVGDDDEWSIAIGNVKRGKTVFDFGGNPKPTGAKKRARPAGPSEE